MKKEIEVFISDYFERNGFGNIQTIDHGSFNNSLKATLILEMPEKKIKITESEWEEARDVWDTDLTVAKNLTAMKRKLFGDA